eukprot:5763016-Amphidinium_carterae.1
MSSGMHLCVKPPLKTLSTRVLGSTIRCRCELGGVLTSAARCRTGFFITSHDGSLGPRTDRCRELRGGRSFSRP